jgi:hypothetical protein
MEQNTDDTQIQNMARAGTTLDQAGIVANRDCIKKYGSRFMEKYQKAFTSIMLMAILQTMRLKILSLLSVENISRLMPKTLLKKREGYVQKTSRLLVNQQELGIVLRTEVSGIVNMLNDLTSENSKRNTPVHSVALNFSQNHRRKTHFVPILANQNLDENLELTTSYHIVPTAKNRSQRVNMQKQNFVLSPVQQINVGKADRQNVYNLTIDGTPEYFANGILVHNCMDAIRYAIHYITKRGWAGLTVKQFKDVKFEQTESSQIVEYEIETGVAHNLRGY